MKGLVQANGSTEKAAQIEQWVKEKERRLAKNSNNTVLLQLFYFQPTKPSERFSPQLFYSEGIYTHRTIKSIHLSQNELLAVRYKTISEKILAFRAASPHFSIAARP